jgi:hypothetical protein
MNLIILCLQSSFRQDYVAVVALSHIYSKIKWKTHCVNDLAWYIFGNENLMLQNSYCAKHSTYLDVPMSVNATTFDYGTAGKHWLQVMWMVTFILVYFSARVTIRHAKWLTWVLLSVKLGCCFFCWTSGVMSFVLTTLNSRQKSIPSYIFVQSLALCLKLESVTDWRD